MAWSTRTVAVGMSISIPLILGEIYVCTSSTDKRIRALTFRANFVCVIQLVLFCFTRYVWTKFSPIFDSVTKQKVKPETSTTYVKKSSSDFEEISDRIRTEHNKASLWRLCLFIYLLFCHLSYLSNLVFMGTNPSCVSVVMYVCLGSFVQLLTGSVIASLLKFCMKLTRLKCQLPDNYWKYMAICYAVLFSTYGIYTVSRPPTLITKGIEIKVKDLPDAFENLRIIQLSDIHLGPTVGKNKMDSIVEMTNALKPDVVVLTGDLADGSVMTLHEAAAPLKQLQSKYGRFFVSGNHEYYTGDVDNWFKYLQSLGFTVLHNSNIKLSPLNGLPGEICMAGTDDIDATRIGYSGHGMNLKMALSSCSPNYPTILLAHQPKAAKLAFLSDYRVDLVLSGHTHGGQMFPLIIGAYLANPFYAGLYKYGTSSHVYVSMGTVYWGIPMRVLTTREITEIVLRKL